jgi:flagellar basal-body rod modification protein FlgD
MVTAVTSSSTNSTTSSASTASSSSLQGMDPTQSQDRFLKLLVAQLNNQDPMNPMDNAQMTTQIAQINTVSGIQQLNQTMTSMVGQFTTLQMMQGSAMVGHEVLVEGSSLTKDGTTGRGAVSLSEGAEKVVVEVVNSSGAVVSTQNIGPLQAGNHSFETDLSKFSSTGPLTFKVTATNGTKTVGSTPLIRDKVSSISSGTNGITIDLANNTSVAYGSVKAVL